MEKNKIKLSKDERDKLRFIVEDFLNYESDDLYEYLRKYDKDLKYLLKLNSIFFSYRYLARFGIEKNIINDLSDDQIWEIRYFILKVHAHMKKLWDLINCHLDGYECWHTKVQKTLRELKRIKMPTRLEKAHIGISTDCKYATLQKEFSFVLASPLEKLTYRLDFAGNKINFHERISHDSNPDIYMEFIHFFREIPLDYLQKCSYCNKRMVKTSKDKINCKRCTPKKHQKEKHQRKRLCS